jgi:hypothetical protein
MVLDKEAAEEGDTIEATLTLEEINGQPTPHQTVVIEHAADNGGFSSKEGTTDASGQFKATFPVFPNSHVGIVEARYARFGRIWHSNDPSYNVLPSNASQGLRIVEPFPPASLKPGESATILAEVRSNVSGIPIPLLGGIEAAADAGSVTPAVGTTDQNGIATFTFVAGPDNGRGKITIQRQIGGSIGVDPELIQSVWNIAITSDAVLNVNTSGGENPAASAVGPATFDPSLAVSVIADLRVGEDRIEALPVQFTLDGDGTVAVIDSSTDSFGQAESFFIPPAAKAGTSEMCATTVVDSDTLTECVDIEYEASLAFNVVGTIGPFGSGYIIGVNNKGEVAGQLSPISRGGFLWLPMAAYGLPHGLKELGHPRDTEVSDVTGISDAGQISGYSDGRFAGDPFLGWVWENGGFTVINSGFPLDINVQPNGISNGGLLTGYAEFPDDGEGETRISAFTYPPAVELNLPSGGTDHLNGFEGWTINDQGQVAGQVADGTPAVWMNGPQSGTVISFLDDHLSGSNDMAINNLGQIVFCASARGLLWDGGQQTKLDFGCKDINDLGWIVGRTVGTGAHAVLWIDGEALNLNDLLADPSVSGHLTQAWAVSDTGYIVARGGNLGNFFLLEPVGGQIH